MAISAQRPLTNSYPAEVSGWDSDQAFFVERSELEWNEETGKYLGLHHSLRPGAMIFLRLLQPLVRIGLFRWPTTLSSLE